MKTITHGLSSYLFLLLLTLTLPSAYSQPKYRTFSQTDLMVKKALKAGKVTSNVTRFTFRNDSTGITVDGLEASFNSRIIAIVDSGGFTGFNIGGIPVAFHATGKSVAPGDSVSIAIHFDRRHMPKLKYTWTWFVDGAQAGLSRSPTAGSYQPFINPPNGGNVLEFLYKKVVTRPTGVVLGKANAPTGGWVRFLKADRRFFFTIGPIFCFSFQGEIKNPKLSRVDNTLAGDLHVLRLAVMANDAGVTEPDTPATRLGDLIYNDTLDVTDPFNGMTVRAIMALTDSALTYCSLSEDVRIQTFLHIGRINSAFLGVYAAKSWSPFVLAGTQGLPYFLLPNPLAQAQPIYQQRFSFVDEAPPRDLGVLRNYPNPFNPTTTIRFNLLREALVTIKVYNVIGQEIAVLADAEEFSEGISEIEFDGSDVPSGLYYCRIVATDQASRQIVLSDVGSMLLLK